ncbi:MAG: class I SAM-dependent methyltransferase [Spirochaetales bacterium]|nr:class I SAM-dependent methyltransferase [Spirochaetales bacterium]
MDSFEYLRSFINKDSEIIKNLEGTICGRTDIQPSVEPELGKFLGLIIRLTNAKRVLEIGSGIGYSAMWLGEAVKATSGKVVTIDNHERTHKEVIKNINDAGLSRWVEKKLGNAEDLIMGFEDEWDIVFQDGGKYLYPMLHDKIVRLTRIGGLIIADDTLFKINTEVRKGLGNYMDEYNKMVFADTRLYSTILPVGHGITLSLKTGSDNE